MAKITIGGVERTTAPMSLRTFKKAWAAFKRVKESVATDTDAMDEMVLFVSFALEGAEAPEDRLTAEQIDGQISMPEVNRIKDTIKAILAENGFAVGEEEAAALNAPTPSSTETSTGLSSESLQA